MKEIVINRMYTGSYLQNNLGHEIINLFKADDGHHYVYLNDTGKYGKEHIDSNGECTIQSMLLVHTLEGTNTVEVLGVALGLHPVYDPCQSLSEEELAKTQLLFTSNNNITYGGMPMHELFARSKQQSVYITFDADKVLRTKKDCRIYIRMANKEGQNPNPVVVYKNDKLIQLEDVKLGQGLKSYVGEDSADYSILEQLINDVSNWEDSVDCVKKEDAPRELTFLSICRREYDEVAYSNALAYFIQKYQELAYEFEEKILFGSGIKFAIHPMLHVLREEGHTDLLIYHNKGLVVVENKLKSDINGIEKNEAGEIVKTQLDSYVEYVDKFKAEHQLEVLLPQYYILVPDYSPLRFYHQQHINPYDKHIKIGEKFSLVYYSELYEFLKTKSEKTPYKKDSLFKEFVSALEPHTHLYDDSLYTEMYRLFYERIFCNDKK